MNGFVAAFFYCFERLWPASDTIVTDVSLVVRRRSQFEEYDTVVGFRLVNKEAAKLLWTSCMEQHAFFRLGRAPPSEQVRRHIGSDS